MYLSIYLSIYIDSIYLYKQCMNKNGIEVLHKSFLMKPLHKRPSVLAAPSLQQRPSSERPSPSAGERYIDTHRLQAIKGYMNPPPPNTSY